MPRSKATARRGGIHEPLANKKIVINIGGQKFHTQQSTLKNVQDTRLSNLNERDSSYDIEKDEYFFDRSPRLFGSVLDYFRTGDLHFPHCHCGPAIKAELEFWGIDDNEISNCCWRAFKAYEDESMTLKELRRTLEAEDHSCDTLPDDLTWFQKWRHIIWNFLDKPETSKGAQIWAIAIFFLIMVSIAVTAMESHPMFRVNKEIPADIAQNTTNPKLLMYYTTDLHAALQSIESFCIVVFTLELVIRFLVSPSKLRFIKSVLNIIDFLSVIPSCILAIMYLYDKDFWLHGDLIIIISYLSLTSVFRVLRVFKIIRHYRGLQLLLLAFRSSIRELILLFLLIIMGMCIFSTLIYFAEFHEVHQFPSIFRGFWWSIITMTTVGYGDAVPTTLWGYIIGGICAISGMLITGLPIPIIASNFNHYNRIERFAAKLMKKKSPKSQNWQNLARAERKEVVTPDIITVSTVESEARYLQENDEIRRRGSPTSGVDINSCYRDSNLSNLHYSLLANRYSQSDTDHRRQHEQEIPRDKRDSQHGVPQGIPSQDVDGIPRLEVDSPHDGHHGSYFRVWNRTAARSPQSDRSLGNTLIAAQMSRYTHSPQSSPGCSPQTYRRAQKGVTQSVRPSRVPRKSNLLAVPQLKRRISPSRNETTSTSSQSLTDTKLLHV